MTRDAAIVTLVAFPSRPEDRLRRALRNLESALADQGAAVTGFRADLSALSAAVSGLDESLQDYRGKLTHAALAAGRARDEAKRLGMRAAAMAGG